MKKTGKALSLVLSLALVASTIPMAFASAATASTANVQGNSEVTLTDANSNDITAKPFIAAGKTATAAANVTYRDKYGKDYYILAADNDNQNGKITWTSSDTSVATVKSSATSTDTTLPINTDKAKEATVTAKSQAGTTTISAYIKNCKLYDRANTDPRAKAVVADVTASIKVTVTGDTATTLDNKYPKGTVVYGTIPFVNAVGDDSDTKTVTLNTFGVGTSDGINDPTPDTAGSYFYKISNIDANQKDSLSLYTISASDAATKTDISKVTAGTNKVAVGTYTTVAKAGVYTVKPYIGSFTVNAYTDATCSKLVASEKVTVGKNFDASAATGDLTFTKDDGHNGITKEAAMTGTDATPFWDLTGYNVKVSDTATTGVAVTGKANLGNITSGELNITASGEKITGVDPVTVSGDAKVGQIATKGSVTVSGDNTVVGSILGASATDAKATINGGATVTGDIGVKSTATFDATDTEPLDVDVDGQGTGLSRTAVKGAINGQGAVEAYNEASVGAIDTTGNVEVGAKDTTDTTTTSATVNGGITTAGTVDVKGYNTVVNGSVQSTAGAITVKGASVKGDVSAVADTSENAVNPAAADVTIATISNADNTKVYVPHVSGNVTGKGITISGTATNRTTVTGLVKSYGGKVTVSGAAVGNISAGNICEADTSVDAGSNAVNVNNSTVNGYVYVNDIPYGAVSVQNSTVNGEIHSDAIGDAKAGAVAVDSSNVGDVTASDVCTVTATQIDAKGNGVDTKAGNVTGESNITVGGTSDNGNITVASVKDGVDPIQNNKVAGTTIVLYQNGASNKVTVGAVAARAETPKTILEMTDISGTFASLDNFNSISSNGAEAGITVNKPVATETLTVGNGKLTVPQFTVTDLKTSSSATVTLTDTSAPSVVKGTLDGTLNVAAPSAKAGDNVLKVSAYVNPANVSPVNFKDEASALGNDKMVNITVKAADLTGVTINPSAADVTSDKPATLTVVPSAGAVLPTDATGYTWTVSDDSFKVTPSADGKTATVSVEKAPEKDTTADVTVKVKNFTATAKVTAKAATAPVPVVKPSNFTIDSMPKTMKLGQVYTVKINSKDGSKPNYAFANGFAVITKNVTKGNDTYLTFTAQSVGDHGVYIGDKKVAIINVAGSICDTRTVTVKQGKVYQFKVTSKSTPVFTVATVGTLKPVRVSGHDYFYKVTATSNKGDHGVYVNGAKIAHCIFA